MSIPDTKKTKADAKGAGQFIIENLIIPGGKYLEVGVFRGMTLTQIVDNTNMIVTGVDRWKVVSKEIYDDHNVNTHDLPYFYYWLQTHYGNRCRLIRDSSDEAAKRFKSVGEKFDVIFIDGDHTYEGVRKDLALYWPLLKDKGIFSGHDYQIASVKKAVDEFAKKHGLRIQQGPCSIWWINT